ncbi:MAG TPA: hypothetical protein PL195_11580 [bacterium]|nr:hypothetical protein [bacterium]HQJ59468.1 hypothetical protein [bacterium]
MNGKNDATHHHFEIVPPLASQLISNHLVEKNEMIKNHIEEEIKMVKTGKTISWTCTKWSA